MLKSGCGSEIEIHLLHALYPEQGRNNHGKGRKTMKHQNTAWGGMSLVILAGVLLFCALSNASAQTVPQIAEKALAATVSLEMQDRNGMILGQGSGFFVRPNLIATNYHVIEGAARGTAKLVSKDTTYSLEGITAMDKTKDLALLKIRTPIILVKLAGIQHLPLGDSNTVRIGDTVYVAGNPRGLEGTFSDGIISSRRDRDTNEHLQMTAPISPGSSGGPVLNGKGEVIGVSVSIYRGIDSQNLNFAIPSNYLKILLTQSGAVKPFSQQSQAISAETYLFWGCEKYEGGDYEGAIADFDNAIQLKSDYANAYLGRGIAKADLRQDLAAIADYNTTIQLKPDYAYTYYMRGITKGRLGQHFAAITDYDTAIRLKPDYADAYQMRRGTVKGHLGQYFDAIADCDTAIRLKPDYADAYHTRAIAKTDLQQYLAAIADYDTAIRLKPDYADAYQMRGTVKARLEQYFAAIADYDTVIRLKPDYADAYISRGIAKGKLGQYFDAITDYDTAIRLKPNNAFVYYIRGMAKWNLGSLWEAKQDLKIALRLAKQAGNENLTNSITNALQLIDGLD